LMLLDGLWFAGVLSNKQRKDAAHDLRRLVYRLGRELIDLERRARESALRAGKGAELRAADDDAKTRALASGSLVDEGDASEASEGEPSQMEKETEQESDGPP
jgi:hypothetical protein